MLKKTITYTDFEGTERTEDFYFNLTKAELADMELTTEGGYKERIDRIVNAKDQTKLIALFKEIIHKAYGVKSDDGRRFIKNEEVLNDFIQTQAYSDLYMGLVTNTDEASAFVTGILPQDLAAEANKNNIIQNPNA